ncbi:MAG: MgtC/SapB family protein [Bacteroidota bacterium]|jgi:putative Mg2+ transporter-C (MgtC) family protein
METKDLLQLFLPTFLTRTIFAVVCGAIIGVERERRGKPAGFRTMTLICLGSTIYMLIGEFCYQRFNIPGIDPTRIAAQVVTGIGFIGAGAIIQSRGTITGMTTAATIWVVAGIGLIIGAGFPWIGFICTFVVLGTLILLHKLEPKLLGSCRFVRCEVVFVDDGGRTRAELAVIFSEHDFDFAKFDVQKVDHKTSRLTFSFCTTHPSHHRFLSELWRTPGIIEVTTER